MIGMGGLYDSAVYSAILTHTNELNIIINPQTKTLSLYILLISAQNKNNKEIILLNNSSAQNNNNKQFQVYTKMDLQGVSTMTNLNARP